MAKKQTPVQEPKVARTIKVSTVVISVLVLLGLIAAFIGGIAYNENYNSTVEAKAVELSKEFTLKENQ